MRRILLLILCLLPFAARADALLLPTPYVQVTGHGALNVTPDMLRISLTVEQTDKNLSVAKNSVTDRVQKIIALAKRLGIAARDIDATVIYIAPQYDWQNNTRRYLGQHVSRSVRLTLRDINAYSDLVDGLVKIGVTSIDSVLADHSDLAKLKTQALALAVQDAHAKAAALAASADVTLGPVYSISENAGFNLPRPPLMADARMAAVPGGNGYNPGNIEITADVQMVYLIKQVH